MTLVSHFVLGKVLTVLGQERRAFAVKSSSSGKFLLFILRKVIWDDTIVIPKSRMDVVDGVHGFLWNEDQEVLSADFSPR